MWIDTLYISDNHKLLHTTVYAGKILLSSENIFKKTWNIQFPLNGNFCVNYANKIYEKLGFVDIHILYILKMYRTLWNVHYNGNFI